MPSRKQNQTERKSPAGASKKARQNANLAKYSEMLRVAMTGLQIDEVTQKRFLGHARARQWHFLVNRADELTTQTYGDPDSHFRNNQLAHLIKKVPFVHPELNPEQSALKKFLSAEHKCKRVNQKLLLRRKAWNPYGSFYESMRLWILDLLGEEPNLEKILSKCDFGPGSSIGVSGTRTHPLAKLASEVWTVTPACRPYAETALWLHSQIRAAVLSDGHPIYCEDPYVFRGLIDKRILLVDHNKIDFVPKTAKTHRSIAIEPMLNGFVQKGIDIFLRERLKRAGIDLTKQEPNQFLAWLGSLPDVADPFVTIDLSMASDTISLQIVKELLPPAWFSFLNAVRSPAYRVGESSESVRYEKFSSMGNGFSFPLETLIFASAVHSVYEVVRGCGSVFRVYGDDIVVRQSTALLLIELLRDMGFKINVDKTFLFGPFRESCGADYFEGANVRPYTLDFIPSRDVDYIKIANGITDTKYFHNSNLWDYAVSQVPNAEQYYRPVSGPADAAITVPLDVFMASGGKRWFPSYQNWGWKEILQIPVEDETPYQEWEMYGVLRGQPSKNGRLSTTLRRETRTVRRWSLPDVDTHQPVCAT